MSKSNQESSPITQWQKEKINPILGELFATGEIAHTAGLTHEMRMGALRGATEAITSATIELLEGLIGNDTPLYSHQNAHEKAWYEARNELRASLRQSLKEMKNE